MTPFALYPPCSDASGPSSGEVSEARPGANALTDVADLDALEFSLRHRLQVLLIESELATDPAVADALRALMAPLEAQLAALPRRR